MTAADEPKMARTIISLEPLEEEKPARKSIIKRLKFSFGKKKSKKNGNDADEEERRRREFELRRKGSLSYDEAFREEIDNMPGK